MRAAVFLPDPTHGYYRGSRFDWSGIVACVSLNGHQFFGEWFDQYNPLTNDAVTGPAEEFRSPQGEIGYDEARPGEEFLKIGVGTLRRKDQAPYAFGTSYPIVNGGRWSVTPHKDSIVFRHELVSALGYSYVYQKTVQLDHKTSTMRLTHRLTNTGTKPIHTAVYDHDFFMFDGKATGPGMELRLPFTPVPDKPLPEAAKIDGNTIRFVSALEPHKGVGAYITGYTDKVSDYDIVFTDTSTGMRIRQTSDKPMSRMYLWATQKTVCPEAYIALDLLPGTSQEWSIEYRFATR